MTLMIVEGSRLFQASILTIAKSLNYFCMVTTVENCIKNYPSFHQPVFVIISLKEIETGTYQQMRESILTNFVVCLTADIKLTEKQYKTISSVELNGVCFADELEACLQTLLMRSSFVSPRLAEYVKSGAIIGLCELTETEHVVLWYMLRGCTTPQIANQLNRSKRTIDNHRTNIAEKLGVGGGPGSLIAFVLQHKEQLIMEISKTRKSTHLK